MRILTVTHFFEDHGGGIERVAGHLCRQFNRLGADAVWAASSADPAPNGEIEAVPLACFNPTERLTGLPMPVPGLRAMRTLAKEVRRSDAIVVHDALYITSVVALLMAKALGRRVILVQHIAGIAFSSRLLRLVMRLANGLVTQPMLWAADERVFISDTVRRELLGNPPRLPSTLFFNGVDSTIFHPAEAQEPPPEAMAGIDLPPGARRILFVGRYVEKKGLTVLRLLAEARPDLAFYLVGNGPIRVDGWGLGNVHDLGPRSAAQLADLYRWADLLLLPSVGEGYPLVIQEAMACGLPVVCGEPSKRADPAASQWICGVSIDLTDPLGSARRCAEAIYGFDLSPSERAEMARFATARYDWAAMARGVIELLQGGRLAQPA